MKIRYSLCSVDNFIDCNISLWDRNEPIKSVSKSHQMIHSWMGMIWLQLFSSRQLTDSHDPFRVSLQWTELTTKNREVLADAVRNKL